MALAGARGGLLRLGDVGGGTQRTHAGEGHPTGGAPIVTRAVGTATGGTTPPTARSTYPEWKALASLTWDLGDWTTLWRTRYIGSTADGPAPALPVKIF